MSQNDKHLRNLFILIAQMFLCNGVNPSLTDICSKYGKRQYEKSRKEISCTVNETEKKFIKLSGQRLNRTAFAFGDDVRIISGQTGTAGLTLQRRRMFAEIT